MATVAKKKPQEHDYFVMIFWTPQTPKKDLQAAFRNKRQWVVPTSQGWATWHASILSNLSCRYTVPERVNIDFVRAALEDGLSKAAFDRLKMLIDTTGEDLSKVIRVPSRTVARRKLFKPDESERILRVAAAFQRAIEVMEDLGKARRWFSSPKRALAGKTPLAFCDTALGAEEVRNLLGRIEHGVFS